MEADTSATNIQKKDLPEFNFKNVMGDVVDAIYALIFDPQVNRIVVPVMVCLTSMIAKVVISFVPYTEIDFLTYMQQIKLINEGEIDYAQVIGDTGPIVYPAGFVQIFQFLSYVTDGGKNILPGQVVFSYVLTVTNLLVLIIYTFTDHISPWPLYLLLGSKRLMSIYVLRLFNDCFTTLAMVGVTLFLQQASYWHQTSSLASFLLVFLASDLFSIAISIKMNALLYLPGFLVVSYFLLEENVLKLIVVLAVIPVVQVLTGWKFLLPLFNDEDAKSIRWNYINQAFNFKRKFSYQWTVNWKFNPEVIFSSDNFAASLLFLHLFVILIFTFTRYLSPKIIHKSFRQLIIDAFKPISTISPQNLFLNHKIGPQLIFLVLSTSNVIGVLFSRSLHYQFLSWYCWQFPFLLHSTGYNVIVCGLLWIVHEWTWLKYPASAISSAVLVGTLSITLYGVWSNEKIWFEIKPDVNELKEKEKETKTENEVKMET
ncbi:Dolichyl-phosphate-mannose-glycolipid alpha-mannosyltransferase [Scheffersomyces coipomensis]|uniref:Dolichyl-phosphate-mannose-glycolipid alpha-mannosyltransferase n=1 Tax=Scheffersomyces coipomensis TaxID=1788519 RepID=UPI00315C79BB